MGKPVAGRSEELVTSRVLFAVGSAIPILWGVAHIIPTKVVVAGLGPLSPDIRRILTMEWVAEGLALVSLGAFLFWFASLYLLDTKRARADLDASRARPGASRGVRPPARRRAWSSSRSTSSASCSGSREVRTGAGGAR